MGRLRTMMGFAEALGQPAQLYCDIAARVQASFARFINDETGGLYDVLDGPSGNDGAIRPNQILAVSLPFSPLRSAVQARVVRLCGEE